MEAWDDRDKVRPIPIEDDAVSFGAPEPERAERAGPARPWLPLAIALTALGLVVGSVTVFGALRFDDPPPQDPDAFSAVDVDEDGSTTTAPPLPPRLEDVLEGTNDRLTLIAVNDAGVWALLWDPSFREPRAVPLSIEAIPGGGASSATFDASGRTVALEVCPPEYFQRKLAGDDGPPIGCDIYVGSSTDLGTNPDIEGTTGFIWHASEVGRIAWLEADDGMSVIFTGDVNILSGSVTDVQEHFAVTGAPDLVQWDAHGFVVSDGTTTAYTSDGDLLWSVDGYADTGTDTIITVGQDETRWAIIDRTTGEVIQTSAPSESLVFVTTSESADLIGRISAFGYAYSLTINGGGLSAPRILSLPREHVPIGFSADGQYFLFQSESGNTLAFVDWRTGATRELSAPAGYRIIGLDLG